MKKIYSFILTALLLSTVGVGNAWGVWIDKENTAHVYFDNTNTNWGAKNVYFAWISATDNSYFYHALATKISNTNLYVWQGNTNWTISDVFWFTGSWGNSGESSKGYSDVTSYADDYTNKYNGSYGFAHTSCHMITLSGTAKNWTLAPSYIEDSYEDGYSTLNFAQTIAQAVNTGSGYAAPSTSVADVAITSGYVFTDYATCSAIAAGDLQSIAQDATYATIANNIGYTASITVAVSNIASGYRFDGWYDGDTKVSSETSYTYRPTAANTITARFCNFATATIGSTGWTTFCSNGALNLASMSASTGTVKAFYASSANASVVTLTPTTTTVPAGEGLMLKGTAGATITISVATSSADALTGNLLVGCQTATTVEYNSNSGYNYVLVNNGGTGNFQHIVSGDYGSVEIPAGKAYLSLSAAPSGSSPDRLRIVEAEENATNIEAFEANDNVGKFFENGQLFIMRDGVVYDVTGRVIR